MFLSLMAILLAFDNDGVLRDESVSYERAIRDTVASFDSGTAATDKEITDSRAASNDDWERTFEILRQRGVYTAEQKEETLKGVIMPRFQELYLGELIDGRFTGYINDEPWLADNALLSQLSQKHPLIIVSGAPQEEIRYALRRNNAEELFSLILGMHDISGKAEGLEKAIAYFSVEQTYFCDDRPSGVKAGVSLSEKGLAVVTFGIRPPQETERWDKVLLDAGAERVFPSVKEYCNFFLENA